MSVFLEVYSKLRPTIQHVSPAFTLSTRFTTFTSEGDVQLSSGIFSNTAWPLDVLLR